MLGNFKIRLGELKRRLSPEEYMGWKLENLKSGQSGYAESVQEILDLDISILAKFLFISESADGADKTIGKLSIEQKYDLLQEVKKINLEDNSGRVWMYNHIEELCRYSVPKGVCSEDYMQSRLNEVMQINRKRDYGENIQKILDLDISVLAKFLFISESYNGVINAIGTLKKEQRYKLLQEVKEINLEDNSGRVWMYNHIEKLCS